ncbi:MAG: hypothetical protein U9N62_06065 [Thermotogota bacterium]|nr:hypothetical protein [Thermotogota bacterium]
MESKKQGFISGICFLIVFSAAFFMIWNVISLLEEQYREKISELHSLKNLSTYDTRANIYAILEASTETSNTFDEEVYINGNRIYLDETGEIYIQRGE